MLSGLNYYVVDPGSVICGGIVAPVYCQPTIVGGDYIWYFGDGFTGAGQSATLQMGVQKRCSGTGDLVATVYYDDFCNDDSTYDDICSTGASESPVSLLSGDLLIEMNPSIYYATTNSVEWKIYLTNRGTGTASNVWVDDVLGAGLDYVSAVVGNMTGVTITADQDHEGNPINGCTISITEMAAGEQRVITLDALLTGCNNLTNDVEASWGCIGYDCSVPVTDSSVVEIQQPLIVHSHVITTPADACSTLTGSITLKNAGQTACYDLQITETLPVGLNMISGTTQWRLNQGAWNGPHVTYDPNPTTSPLMWTSTEIPSLAVLNLEIPSISNLNWKSIVPLQEATPLFSLNMKILVAIFLHLLTAYLQWLIGSRMLSSTKPVLIIPSAAMK